MDRDDETIEQREMLDKAIAMMTDGVLVIEDHCRFLRRFIADYDKGKLPDLRSNETSKDSARSRALRSYYESVKEKLLTLEATCQGYRNQMRSEVAWETKARLLPPSHLSAVKLERAFKLCGYQAPSMDEQEPRISQTCPCEWKNVPESELEPTKDLLSRFRYLQPSLFDESDLKLKQELCILRMKTFVLPWAHPERSEEDELRKKASPTEGKTVGDAKNVFIESAKVPDSFVLPSIDDELRKVGTLKFVDGSFKTCEIWKKLLDAHGNQLRSKWYLVVRPQIELLLKKRSVPVVHLLPAATFEFLSKIPENGIRFVLTKEDLLPLLASPKEVGPWLRSWRLQYRTIEGKDIAATMIQKFWRGYWIRKKLRETECKYVAASVIWLKWITLKKKRLLHQRYLDKMLIMLSVTKELVQKLSEEYEQVIRSPHLVVHISSIGLPLDIRRIMPSNLFSIYQNMMTLKISFLRNPEAEIIYIIPVKPTQDLLSMYYDLVESVCPDENAQSRVTFVELSEAETFRDCSFNASRTLFCSNGTLAVLTEKVANKVAYFLPTIMDECDVGVAGYLRVPLLSPDIHMQQRLLNKSNVVEMIAGLGLMQPVYATNIRDYCTLCAKLAEQIFLHTEICLWLIKLNVGIRGMQTAVFLINHISIPFMPIIRKEREEQKDQWTTNPEIRAEFLTTLKNHLPTVVSAVMRLPSTYANWKDFYAHLTKYGCLLQAVPNRKIWSSITVTLFVPGRNTGLKPEWTGTADQLHLDSPFTVFGYMIPQTSMDGTKLVPTVNKLAEALQEDGYFGYVSVDLYCYICDSDDTTKVLIIDVDPYYSFAQLFVDWAKFATKGTYNPTTNSLEADIDISEFYKWRSSSVISTMKMPTWDETVDRFAVCISVLYDNLLGCCSWAKLRRITAECKLTFNAKTKQGCHFVLHDGEQRNRAAMTTISSNMKKALSLTARNLRKLNRSLSAKPRKKSDSTIGAAAELFAKLHSNYQPVIVDKCAENIKLK